MKLFCQIAFLSNMVFIILFWILNITLKVWTPITIYFVLTGIGWLVTENLTKKEKDKYEYPPLTHSSRKSTNHL